MKNRLPAYRVDKTYDWNVKNAPAPIPHGERHEPPVPGTWALFGRRLESPLGIAAGPLLNGKWILYYASLGFSVLTYKTVRSRRQLCYPPPNLTPVDCAQLDGTEPSVPESGQPKASWAVSFGMPSADPNTWRRDVERTRRRLSSNHILSVSVVGTMQPTWSIVELADDYAKCAKWAVESGADWVEANFSCPNVTSCDGQLYQHPLDAHIVAERLKSAVGDRPLILKIGHFPKCHPNDLHVVAFLRAIAPFADAIATTNSIATKVRGMDKKLLFDGQRRGICGAAIRRESVRQTSVLREIITKEKLDLDIIGIGGIQNAAHVVEYLRNGASAVQLATAAMQDPGVGRSIRKELREFKWDVHSSQANC